MADEFQCEACGASFDSREELEQHNREEHGEEETEEVGREA